MGLIREIFNGWIGWFQFVDSNQSSNGLHNSQVNAGVKRLVNKGLYVSDTVVKLLNYMISNYIKACNIATV